MNKKIEKEIELTLQRLGDDTNIEVSPMFADMLNGKIAKMHTARGVDYRSKSFYPVIIILLVVMNISACVVSFTGNSQTDQSSDYQNSVLASEYSIGQNTFSSFLD
ncbi:MAG: hypothetical protein JEZ07_10830 [Phycisphaerae bacterium]|nr:hypothetical protein [Phycisphaerae bacterium]